VILTDAVQSRFGIIFTYSRWRAGGPKEKPYKEWQVVLSNLTSYPPTILCQMLYDLFCNVIGEGTVFQVSIDATQSVAQLNEAIKKKKEPELDAVAADKLTLFRVSINVSDEDQNQNQNQSGDGDGDEDDDKDKDELIKKVHQSKDKKKLNPVCKLSKYFEEDKYRKEETIHILVKVPQGESTD
jgi:Crinkler effector protein N-terminal domain